MTPIQQEAERRWPITDEMNIGAVLQMKSCQKIFTSSAEYGYSLAQQEIERLKGLVELAYQEGTKRHLFPDEHHFWPQFKQQHNL
jgi:hypothetical protein